VWDRSHVQSSDETPLQSFVRRAIEQAPRARDHYDKKIQELSGTKGKPLYDLSRGKGLNPSATMLHQMADVLGQPTELINRAARGESVDPVDLGRGGDDKGAAKSGASTNPKVLPTPDDIVEIDSVDVGYGMGGTYLDTVDGREPSERLMFTRAWLNNFTQAPPEMLFVARGIGDSMMPTILDSDIVIVDRSQRTAKLRDQIWAMSLGDIGMIKRLRPSPDGSMRILSDNNLVPEDQAGDGELHIVGRVVAIVRKV
jgi:hypothetical protein